MRAMLFRLALVSAFLLVACPAPPPEPCPEPATTEGEEQPTDTSEDVPAEAPEEAAAEDTRTVVLDGTPEVPDALRRRLEQYSNTRAASLLGLSDDGSQALVATRFAEVRQLHVVAEPMGARSQITFRDEPVRGAALVPGDANTILLLSDVGGSEDNQVFRLDRRTGRTTMLTDGEHKHGALRVSHDGRQIAYNGNARNGTDMDVYVRALSEDAEPRRFDMEGYWYPLDFSRDGSKLLIGQYVSITDSRVWMIDLASGERTRLSPETPGAYEDATFAANGRTVYVLSDRGGEFRQAYELDSQDPSAEWRALTADVPWNVSEMALSHDGRTLALVTNEDGYGVLRLMDTRTRRIREASGIPRGLVGGLRWAPRANVLGFTLAGATRTGDAYTYDVRRRRLTRWTESEVGGLDTSTFVEPDLVRFESFDEREIPAFVYRPRGESEGRRPVLLYIHGGPESQARPWFSPLTQFLAVERGVAVIAPNVRGSDGYGRSYLALDNADKREDSVKDIGALLDWIAEQPDLDPERVAVYGGSYGGYMVLASLVHYGERLRAGIDVVGISNFVTFLENTRDYRRDLRRAEYGDERDPEMRAHLQAISPLHQVERIRSALFVAQGANDPRVPASEAEQIVSAVRASGRDVWYMLARNEGHGFRRKENRDTFFELSVLFLDRHLLD